MKVGRGHPQPSTTHAGGCVKIQHFVQIVGMYPGASAENQCIDRAVSGCIPTVRYFGTAPLSGVGRKAGCKADAPGCIPTSPLQPIDWYSRMDVWRIGFRPPRFLWRQKLRDRDSAGISSVRLPPKGAASVPTPKPAVTCCPALLFCFAAFRFL